MMTDKHKIIGFAGMSGSGKSTAAEYLAQKHNIPLLQSYTTKQKKRANDTTHKFLSDLEFDTLIRTHTPLAVTSWRDESDPNASEVRYCCLEEDLGPIQSYVVDEKSLAHVAKEFGHKYHITQVFIASRLDKRKMRVDENRIARDEGMFFRPHNVYDRIIYNNDSVDLFKSRLDKLVTSILNPSAL